MKKLWEKLKSVKNIEIIAAVIAVVIIIAIYFTTLSPKTEIPTDDTITQTVTGDSYADIIEGKLHKVISGIKGAGSVAVMVMTDGEGTSELAYDIEEKTVTQTGANGQGTTTTTTNKKPITGTGGKPIVLWTNPPDIIGIVVVATGANDPAVRLSILRAVQTIIGTDPVSIEILNGK